MTKNLKEFLEMSIPPLVLQYILIPGSVRACSGISPAFEIVARHYGFEAYTVQVPGHFLNVILTKEGPIEVDLSYIQFSTGGYASRKELQSLLLSIAKNPFKAVRVQPYSDSANLEEQSYPKNMIEETLESFEYYLEDIKLLTKKDPDSIEEYQDIGGFWAPEFGDDI